MLARIYHNNNILVVRTYRADVGGPAMSVQLDIFNSSDKYVLPILIATVTLKSVK